jgi:hypothetical protein
VSKYAAGLILVNPNSHGSRMFDVSFLTSQVLEDDISQKFTYTQTDVIIDWV